ncbi:hypothetical protein NW762_004788 [Fusarium torreyae]|uniref:Probable Xaa-Pro aminopeptidase P n=1 Tax=Fusarium torreyae TaxID=1237075 RepID=A0A9W8S460_9HYPO|nr:hypothetical protein NW762_004788 [Fusarium torreyae]
MANLDWHAEITDLSDLALLDRSPESEGIDLKAVRLYRLNRMRSQTVKYGFDAVIISDPVHIRYVTGTRNMQVFIARNTPTRSIMFECAGCLHLVKGYETIDQVRTAKSVTFTNKEKKGAEEMADLVRDIVGKRDMTLGLGCMNANVAIALKELGLNIVDAQQAIEMSRTITSPKKIKCIVASLRATEVAVGKLREAVSPGLTENELWSVMHKSVIEQNGNHVETRLLSAGPQLTPWFQGSANYVIQKNKLVALDTDVVGCHGYYSDFSPTFHSGPNPPTEDQKELYRTAHEQVHHNMSILKPGLTFREYADQARDIPKHLMGEYPYLYYRGDFPDAGYDGVIEPGMVLCVESYIGEEGGSQGVKLEQQVLITETGTEVLSEFPFEKAMLK